MLVNPVSVKYRSPMRSKKTINTTVAKLVPMVTLTRTKKAVDTRAVVAVKFSYGGEGDKYRH